MKKIIFVAIVLFASSFLVQAQAQVVNQGPVTYSFGGVYKNANGAKLSKQELQNYFNTYQYADYLNAARKFKNGAILTGVGVGLIGGTLLWLNVFASKDVTDDNLEEMVSGAFYGGMISVVTLAGGALCTIIGVPKLLIANNKLKGIAGDYNNKQNLSMSFGCQQYGLGFALSF